MTRILVTGANGHLGANTVRSLLSRGHEVIPFVRQTSDLRGLKGLGLSYRYGDIMDVDSLRAAAEGCEVIIHSAAVYRFFAPIPEEVMEPALTGTQNVFTAAKDVDVRRIVYTSTTFAVGATTDPNKPRTPNDWNDDPHMAYCIAKLQAEKLAWELADKTGIPMIGLCPNGIMGPYDYALTPTMALLRNLINGSGVTNKGGAGFVDVRDVAEIHAMAVEGGEPGQRYIVAGNNIEMKTLGEIITQLTGIKPRHIGAGRRIILGIASMMELGAKFSGAEPLLTRDMAKELVERYHFYDCEKTWKTFGFTPRNSENMVADAIRWLLFTGQIQPSIASRLSDRFSIDPVWKTTPLSV